jgi:hypothetical protein
VFALRQSFPGEGAFFFRKLLGGFFDDRQRI